MMCEIFAFTNSDEPLYFSGNSIDAVIISLTKDIKDIKSATLHIGKYEFELKIKTGILR